MRIVIKPNKVLCKPDEVHFPTRLASAGADDAWQCARISLQHGH